MWARRTPHRELGLSPEDSGMAAGQAGGRGGAFCQPEGLYTVSRVRVLFPRGE